jgi:indolepyruvate ferredoxin oxidoreductase
MLDQQRDGAPSVANRTGSAEQAPQTLPAVTRRCFSMYRATRTRSSGRRGLVHRLDGYPGRFQRLVLERSQRLNDYASSGFARTYVDCVTALMAPEFVQRFESCASAIADLCFRFTYVFDGYEVARQALGGPAYSSAGTSRRTVRRSNTPWLRAHGSPVFLARLAGGSGRGFVGAGLCVCRVLAWLRFLRGSPLDVFGWTPERRRERNLLTWFEAVAQRLVELAPVYGEATLLPLLEQLDGIRGFGQVRASKGAQIMPDIERRLTSLETDTTARNRTHSPACTVVRLRQSA